MIHYMMLPPFRLCRFPSRPSRPLRPLRRFPRFPRPPPFPFLLSLASLMVWNEYLNE